MGEKAFYTGIAHKLVPGELKTFATYLSRMFSATFNAFIHFLLANGAAFYIRLLGWSTETEYHGRENIPQTPFIYAFWHSRLLFFVYSHRRQDIHVLVSKSTDGELISSVIAGFGFSSIRGSSSRAGRESVVQIIRALRENKICAITPDGPKGPAREVKDGLSYIARKTGYPVVPIACAAKRKKIFASWDRFVCPLPFNRAVIIVGKPVYVLPGDDLAAANTRLGGILNGITAEADALIARR